MLVALQDDSVQSVRTAGLRGRLYMMGSISQISPVASSRCLRIRLTPLIVRPLTLKLPQTLP